MPSNPATDDLREALEGLVKYRTDHLTGDEKLHDAIDPTDYARLRNDLEYR